MLPARPGPAPPGHKLRPSVLRFLRPSPAYLLVLVLVLAGVVVVQELNLKAVTQRGLYYRKALVAIGDKRGQTVAAAGIEEFGTAAGGGQHQAQAAAATLEGVVGGLLKETAQVAAQHGQQAAAGADAAAQQAGGAEAAQLPQAAAAGAAAGAASGAAAGAGAAQGLPSDQSERAVQRTAMEQEQYRGGETALAALQQQQQGAASGGAGSAQQQQPQVLPVADPAAVEQAKAQAEAAAVQAAAAAAQQQKQQLEQQADATGTAATAAAGASPQQQSAGAATTAATQQVAAGNADAGAAAQQAAAAAQQQQQQAGTTAAVAAGSEAQGQQAGVQGQVQQAAVQGQQAAQGQAQQGQQAQQLVDPDEIQPLGPIEDEWWSALEGPRSPQPHRPHSVTARLVQPDALRPDGPDALRPDGPDALRPHEQAAAGSGTAGSTEDESCKIYVLDAAREFGPLVGAPICDVNSPFIWPFAAPGRGIDAQAAQGLQHFDSQYSAGHWITQAIKNSGAAAGDLPEADFVYVDMHCYHAWYMSWHHPLGSKNMSDPTLFIQRTYEMLQDMPRFIDSKGADFGLLQPGPTLRGLFSEAVLCEDLASAFHLVTERGSLCVWTRDSAERGKAMILPYVATTDLGLELPEQPRDLLLYFRGGCGSPDPAVRNLFAAGKMLRYYFVERLAGRAPDVEVACSCDICENHEPHAEVLSKMRRARFCAVISSNVQSSRRLSEAVLSGCIPVFIGPPFHTLPLAKHVDYASMGVFIEVQDTSLWINRSSINWEHNHMISKAWKLDAPVESAVLSLPSLESIPDYLRSLSAEAVAAKQAAVKRERLKFYYPPAPLPWGGKAAGGRSVLGDIVVREMCARGREAKRRRAAEEEAEAAALGAVKVVSRRRRREE